MVQPESMHPDVHKEFADRNCVVQKAAHSFIAMSVEQAYEPLKQDRVIWILPKLHKFV